MMINQKKTRKKSVTRSTRQPSHSFDFNRRAGGHSCGRPNVRKIPPESCRFFAGVDNAGSALSVLSVLHSRVKSESATYSFNSPLYIDE